MRPLPWILSVQGPSYVGTLIAFARLSIVHSFVATLLRGRDLMKSFELIFVTLFTCGKLVRLCLKNYVSL